MDRHRRPVLWLWLASMVLLLPLLPFLPSRLRTGGFDDSTLPSAQAQASLRDDLEFPTNTAAVFFRITSGHEYVEPGARRLIGDAIARVSAVSGVRQVISPELNSRQLGRSGRTAYALVTLDTEAGSGGAQLVELERASSVVQRDGISVETLVVSADSFFRDLQDATTNDLQRAELVTLPIAALTLLLVFGSVVAASLPVIAGAATTVLGLGGILALSFPADMSVFTLNLSSMLALGLGTDYALFLVSRFREEMDRGATTSQAVERAVATAGRAVFFSAGMVLAGLAGLLSFRIAFLRSLGFAGLAAVAAAVLVSMTLLPALLAVLGPRIDSWRIWGRDANADGATNGFWARVAGLVLKRPWPVLFVSIVVLLGAAVPFLSARLSTPDARILPVDSVSRRAANLMAEEFDAGGAAPLLVVAHAPGKITEPGQLSVLTDLTRALQDDPRVARVDSLVSLDPRLTRAQYELLFARPELSPDQWARGLANAIARGNTTLLQVVPARDPLGPEIAGLVDSLRLTVPAPGWRLEVAGVSASAIDLTRSLYGGFPYVVALILATTYGLLFLTFRSVLLPLKAVLMNLLSLGASYGALVAVFQMGLLSGLPAPFAFPQMGYVEATLPILLFCTLFGLSMDYEVFLLSRIREEFLSTGDNSRSVTVGLQASGRVITGAAAIVVAVAGSFSLAADVVQIKALGLGIAIAVLVDATLVRGLLVPATLHLFGAWNWWLPSWLARVFGPSTSLHPGFAAVHGQATKDPLVDESGATDQVQLPSGSIR